MHGLCNHFAIFDSRSDLRASRKDDIIRLCDSERCVDGEQLLTTDPPAPAAAARGAKAGMRIFNIDGREVSACGNATRCVAHLLFEEGGDGELLLETRAGLLKCRRSGPMQVSVELGP